MSTRLYSDCLYLHSASQSTASRIVRLDRYSLFGLAPEHHQGGIPVKRIRQVIYDEKPLKPR